MSAADERHDWSMSCLLDHLADANGAAEDDRTALLCAASATRVGQLRFAGADVHQSKGTGATTLHIAAAHRERFVWSGRPQRCDDENHASGSSDDGGAC